MNCEVFGVTWYMYLVSPCFDCISDCNISLEDWNWYDLYINKLKLFPELKTEKFPGKKNPEKNLFHGSRIFSKTVFLKCVLVRESFRSFCKILRHCAFIPLNDAIHVGLIVQ